MKRLTGAALATILLSACSGGGSSTSATVVPNVASPSPTISASATVKPSVSPTATASATASASTVPAVSPAVATATPTSAVIATASPVATASATATSIATATATIKPTATPIVIYATASPTPTATPTASPLPTPAPTASPTPVHTATPVPTPTPTPTPVPTATPKPVYWLPLASGNSWTFQNGATIKDMGISSTVTCNGSTYMAETLDINSNGNQFVFDVGRLNGEIVVEDLSEEIGGILESANNGCASPLMQDDGTAAWNPLTNSTFTPSIASSNGTQTISAGTIAGVYNLTTKAYLPTGTIIAGTTGTLGYNVIFTWGFAPGIGFTAFGITNNFISTKPTTLTAANGSLLTKYTISSSSY